MSNSNISSEEIYSIEKPATSFEKHIIYCCRAPEYQLRKWLEKVLPRAGFRLIKDNYKADKADKDKRYANVHNMVAIRGENPAVCLVSHTDVCREHWTKSSGKMPSADDYSKWLNKSVSKQEFEKAAEAIFQEEPYRVDPVVKRIIQDNKTVRIIQDRLCKIQVGGDDRLGVAIITWIALNTGYDMGLYFPTDEEVGLKSARACEIPELKDFELLAQVDRGNKSNELVIKIGGEVLCSYEVIKRLSKIGFDMGKMRSLVTGAHTDVYALKSKNWIKNAVNMTCGYHQSRGDDPNEYIHIEEATDTLEYVSNICKDYYVNGI